MFSQACVILFTGGVCLSACWDTPGADTPWEQTPPRVDPLEQTPPWEQTPLAQSMLGDTVNARAVRILLECNLVLCNSLCKSLIPTFPTFCNYEKKKLKCNNLHRILPFRFGRSDRFAMSNGICHPDDLSWPHCRIQHSDNGGNKKPHK